MTGTDLDSLAKGLVEGRVSRGRALKLFGAGLAATAFAGLKARTASADPQTCVVCVCGTGKPCNPKDTNSSRARSSRRQNVCSAGSAFHCPKGCGGITCNF